MRVLFVDGLSSYNGERDARLGVTTYVDITQPEVN